MIIELKYCRSMLCRIIYVGDRVYDREEKSAFYQIIDCSDLKPVSSQKQGIPYTKTYSLDRQKVGKHSLKPRLLNKVAMVLASFAAILPEKINFIIFNF